MRPQTGEDRVKDVAIRSVQIVQCRMTIEAKDEAVDQTTWSEQYGAAAAGTTQDRHAVGLARGFVNIVSKLAAAVIASTNEPEINSKLLAIGVVPRPLTTPDFGAFIADETAKWAKVIKFADMRVD